MRIVNSSQNDKAKGIHRRLANYNAAEGAADYQSWPLCQFENLFLDGLKSEISTNKLLAPKPRKSNLPALQEKLADIETNISDLQTRIRKRGFKSGLDLLSNWIRIALCFWKKSKTKKSDYRKSKLIQLKMSFRSLIFCKKRQQNSRRKQGRN